MCPKYTAPILNTPPSGILFVYAGLLCLLIDDIYSMLLAPYQGSAILAIIEIKLNSHKTGQHTLLTYVSESDILGPIDYFSDIENLVSFERSIFADYSLRNKISPL